MDISLQPRAWHDFFSASAVTAAALLGLMFVAMSLHERQITTSPLAGMRSRANLQALSALVAVSLVVLLPGQPNWVVGAELIAIGAVYAALLARNARRLAREIHGMPRWIRRRLAAQNTLVVFQLAASLSLIVDRGPGLYLEAPVVILGLPVTIFNAWNVLFGGPNRSPTRGAWKRNPI